MVLLPFPPYALYSEVCLGVNRDGALRFPAAACSPLQHHLLTEQRKFCRVRPRLSLCPSTISVSPSSTSKWVAFRLQHCCQACYAVAVRDPSSTSFPMMTSTSTCTSSTIFFRAMGMMRTPGMDIPIIVGRRLHTSPHSFSATKTSQPCPTVASGLRQHLRLRLRLPHAPHCALAVQEPHQRSTAAGK